MSGSELSVECELRNRKNQAAYLLADNSPIKSRGAFLPFRNLQTHQNKLAQRVNLINHIKYRFPYYYYQNHFSILIFVL